MSAHLKDELRRAFDLASLRREARVLNSERHWSQAGAIMGRCQLLREKENRLFQERHPARVELECQRLLNNGVVLAPKLKPGFVGEDLFDSETLRRQAMRNVAAFHQNRLARIQRLEAHELNNLLRNARRENRLSGHAVESFQKVAQNPLRERRRSLIRD